MSEDRDTSLRKPSRFDYKIYNVKGDKVPLTVPKVSVMDQNLESEEKLRVKIKRYLIENDIDLLFDVSDIEDAISEIRSLANSFEDVHVALRRELNDQYAVRFADYDQQINNITDWIKKAKLAIKEKKQASFAAHRDPVAQAKTRLVTEEKHLYAKIDREISTFEDEDSFFISDIERTSFLLKSCPDVIQICSSKLKSWVSIFLRILEIGLKIKMRK